MCKKLVFMLMVLAVVGLAVPARATEYYLRGDWNGWGLADPMTDNGDGTWSGTVAALAAGQHAFKVYDLDTDAWYPGANSWLYGDALGGAVTVGFNTNTVEDGWWPKYGRISESTDPVTWTVVGDFGGAGLPSWDNAGAGMSMAPIGGGIYWLHLNLPVGQGSDYMNPDRNTYAWKAVVTGSWRAIGENERSWNASNTHGATVDATHQYVDFYVDAYTGVVPGPEPATIGLLALGGIMIRRMSRKR
jgi:hypothetical protein